MMTFRCFPVFAALFCLPYVCGAQNKDGQRLLDAAWDHIQRENDSALIFIAQARELARNTDNALLLAEAEETEGLYCEIVKTDYDRTVKHYMAAIRICEKNHLAYAASVYHSLGVLFHTTDNYGKAKLYYHKSLELARRDKDSAQALKCLINLGSVNSSMGRFAKARDLFDESLAYNPDPALQRTIYSNLGNLEIRRQRYADAIPYLMSAVATDPQTGEGGDIMDYSFLLDAKAAMRDFDGIDTLIEKAHSLYTQTSHLRKRSILLKSMGNVYEARGDFKKAAELKDNYIQLYDSLRNMQRDETVYELETRYQTRKKEEEIALRTAERNRFLILWGCSILVIVLLGYLVYLNVRQKRKLNAQKMQLEKLVDEKNLLLKETHHRVKNSFQIVSGLLYLQSENMQDREAAIAVKEAQNRVKSMILIHQKLYSKDQLVGIDTKEYLEDLVRDIVDNQAGAIENLRLDVQAQSLVLGIDTVTPIGLIVNELITNIIKHAFPERPPRPTISVRFFSKGAALHLEIRDNGIGFDGNTTKNSFGLKLIASLSKKLKADLVFRKEGGTVTQLVIHKFEQL